MISLLCIGFVLAETPSIVVKIHNISQLNMDNLTFENVTISNLNVSEMTTTNTLNITGFILNPDLLIIDLLDISHMLLQVINL